MLPHCTQLPLIDIFFEGGCQIENPDKQPTFLLLTPIKKSASLTPECVSFEFWTKSDVLEWEGCFFGASIRKSIIPNDNALTFQSNIKNIFGFSGLICPTRRFLRTST
jgi:hypothetical protein